MRGELIRMIVEHGAIAEQSTSVRKRQRVTCPQCQNAADLLVTSTDRNRRTTDQSFDYFRCEGCGLVFMDPVPQDMRRYYEGGYQEIPATLAELREIATTERYRLEPMLRYKQSGKLLEIGPWMGIFSSNAKDAGFEVNALEIDQQCVDFLNDVVGVRATQSADPATAIERLGEFDVIALWHCLEHLPEPWRMLQNAAAHLAPGGILLVAIPNIESYEFRLLKGRWRNLDAPRHLTFYPMSTLISLCEGAGLRTLEATTTDELSDRFSTETWQIVASSAPPLPYVRRGVARALKTWANRKERLEDSGPGITAVFQRALDSSNADAVVR